MKKYIENTELIIKAIKNPTIYIKPPSKIFILKNKKKVKLTKTRLNKNNKKNRNIKLSIPVEL